ncbi:PleD family two-component system response regulator [Glaciecola siphonariae]|uniref:PleD family two-component system response regulator n=1 Tax=Glaciecola siphonariae TaxID=521012 RepID=A0ABV9LSA0_9ALTE
MNKVMVVDDSTTELLMLSTALDNNGYTVIPVADSMNAVQIAIETQPSFIVLDIFMPNKSGLELCEELKTNPQTESIPILFLTSSNDINDIRRSIHMGCVDYIPKEVAIDDVVSVIRAYDCAEQLKQAWEPARCELKRLSQKYTDDVA